MLISEAGAHWAHLSDLRWANKTITHVDTFTHGHEKALHKVNLEHGV